MELSDALPATICNTQQSGGSARMSDDAKFILGFG